MKTKRGFLGLIFLALIVFIIIMFMVFYFQVRSNGLKLSTGNVIIQIDYNESKETAPNVTIIEEVNQTNATVISTDSNNSFVNLTQ